jgi:superfamily I DNA/RNA helicase
LGQLTKVQQKIVESQSNRILVSAGAGTGKTRVLTSRINHLVKNMRYSEYDILALTFTRYAANEMRERLAGMAIKDVEIRTFHSWALNNLKRFGENTGFGKDTDVITEIERDEILKEIATECRVKLGRNFRYREFIWEMPANDNTCGWATYNEIKMVSIVRNLWNLYQQYRLTDYDKIIYDFVKLVNDSEFVREHLRRQYRHVLIDEFQDTNDKIWSVFQQIDPDNLFIVGDVDQSLYGFNGSRPDIMTAIASEERWTLFKLEENWRCPTEVVSGANRLIFHNQKRIDRNMVSAENKAGRIRVVD